jgi:hypothetical protein
MACRVMRAILPTALCVNGYQPVDRRTAAWLRGTIVDDRVLRPQRNTSGLFVHAQNRNGGSALHLGLCLATRKYLNGRNLATSLRACGSLGRDLSNASAR